MKICTLLYLERRFDDLESLIRKVLNKERHILMTLDEILVKVNENGDVSASAIILLGELSDLIRAAAHDPAKLLAIANKLDADKEALADAIVANTPPVVPPVDPPVEP